MKNNILILSPGRRVDLVEAFVREFAEISCGKVFTLDMDKFAPALYTSAHASFVIDKDFDNIDLYLESIIDICKNNSIKFIITLIDPELLLLSENKEKFEVNGIQVIVSSCEAINSTFDKYEFFIKFKNVLNVVPTYSNFEDVTKALKEGVLNYPIFKKIRTGSGSQGIGRLFDYDDLLAYKNKEEYIFQPCLVHKEYGVDVYIDFISGKVVSLFIKQKLAMRSGETDKAISVFRQDIVDEVLKVEGLGFKGPIDIDIFEDKDGRLYVNEINPRFGGGYPHAYYSGINFIKLLINNINALENKPCIGGYKENVVMMKYNGLMFKDFSELIIKG